MKKSSRSVSLAICLALTASSCSTPGPLRQYGAEDNYGRYYETNDGKLLRVTADGQVWDITCVKFEKARDRAIEVLKGEGYCSKDKRVEDLGQVSRDGDEWDMSNFGITRIRYLQASVDYRGMGEKKVLLVSRLGNSCINRSGHSHTGCYNRASAIGQVLPPGVPNQTGR